MATTQAPDVILAWRDGLLALAANPANPLHKVTIVSGPVSGDPKDKIELWYVEGEATFATWGKTQGRPTKDDKFALVGGVVAAAPGDGEAAITAARARAYALFAELEEFVRDDPYFGLPNTVVKSELTRGDCDQGIRAERRWCQIEFRLEVSARI